MFKSLRYILFLPLVLVAIFGYSQAPVISYATPDVYVVGTAINQLTPVNTGGTPTNYTINVAPPIGLIFNATSGVITGTPTAVSAAASYTITATNNNGSGSFVVTIAVTPPPPVITYDTPQEYIVGTAITPLTPTNTGGSVVSYSINTTLPPGLTINVVTGEISGTPTIAEAATNYTVTATNAGGNGTATIQIIIDAPSPVITSFSPASGPVGTLVTINGTNLSTPTAFTIAGQNAIVVSNTGSALVGMVMPGASTGAVSITTAGGTAGGDGNFTVALTNYPSVQQGSKLVGTGNIGAANQGFSVAVSADGNTAIVGGDQDNSQAGATWVFIRSGGTWSQQGLKLVGTGSVGTAVQGTSVSLSADGNTVVEGGPIDNSGTGAIWVFTRSGGTWSQQGPKLVGTGGTGAAQQGSYISLSADGNTLIESGIRDNANQGAVWVFTRSGGTWTQQGSKLVGTGNNGAAWQGASLCLSADGNTAIVGGDVDNSSVGAVWIYTRSNSTWTQQGSKLVGTGGVGTSEQGSFVSLNADGNTAIVGGADDNSGQGAAWVYTRSGGIWTQQGAKLVGTGNIGPASQGWSVSVSADGNTAMVGGPADNSNQGAAWVYTRSGGTWTQQGSKLVGSGNIGAAYQSIAAPLSADGNTAILGGGIDNTGQGAAWVFIAAPSTAPVISYTTPDIFTVGVAITPLTPLNTGGAPNNYSINGVLPPGLTLNTTTGVISGTPATVTARTTYVITATNTVGPGTTTVTISTTNSISNNALLSTIKLTPSSALTNTGTTGTTTSYTTSVSNATASITVTPTTQDANATVTVNGTMVASATASAAIPLAVGTNTITTVVTAQDGTTTHTYAITVTRAASSNNALLSIIKLTPSSALTNTGTTGTTTTYTTSVSNATSSVTITPTTQDVNATIKVNGVAVTSGTASGSIALAIGQTTITTIVTAQDGTTTHTYSITFTRAALSNNALLSTIKLAPTSALTNTGTTGSTTTYTTTAAGSTTSVTLTPTALDTHATIKVNGIAVTSGTASASIALAAGTTTTINTIVTAQDGVTTHTYSIVVTRLSNIASLSSIKLTPASTLTNTGTVGTTTTYTTTAAGSTTSVTLTPTALDTHATIKVNGVAVTSGTASASIALAAGTTTTINTIVTAQDGVTTHTYSITITRLSNNTLLSAIKLTPSSTLTNTGTNGTTTTYTTSVSNAETSVTVTPTAQDANAKIKVNGIAVTSGTASGSIALAVGSNTINTVVTAQDGTTTRTYSITVTRATGPLHSLYLPVSVVQPADNLNIENDGVVVHQGISPNGDGINDFLTIDGIIAYPDNSLQIIDRNGTLIYKAKGYNNIANVFDGHSGINGRMQHPGTYFYSLDYIADGQNRHKTGFIILRY